MCIYSCFVADHLLSGFCSKDEETWCVEAKRFPRVIASLGVVIYKVCLFSDNILTNGASVFIMLLNKHLLLSAVLFLLGMSLWLAK